MYDIFNNLIYLHRLRLICRNPWRIFMENKPKWRSSEEDFRLFDGGYVESLQTAQLNEEGVHVYVANVRPFISENQNSSFRSSGSNSCMLSSSGSPKLATDSELRSKRVMLRSCLDFPVWWLSVSRVLATDRLRQIFLLLAFSVSCSQDVFPLRFSRCT